jgi:hypothetical protein
VTAVPTPSLEDRIVDLESKVADLHRRLVLLERMFGTVGEHLADRSVVQGKVSYDWQK